MLPFEARTRQGMITVEPDDYIENNAELLNQGKELYKYFDTLFSLPDTRVVSIDTKGKYKKKIYSTFSTNKTDTIILPNKQEISLARGFSLRYLAELVDITISKAEGENSANEIRIQLEGSIRAFPIKLGPGFQGVLLPSGAIKDDVQRKIYSVLDSNKLHDELGQKIKHTHSIFYLSKKAISENRASFH